MQKNNMQRLSLYCNQSSLNLSLVLCKEWNSNNIKKCTEENCNNKLWLIDIIYESMQFYFMQWAS